MLHTRSRAVGPIVWLTLALAQETDRTLAGEFKKCMLELERAAPWVRNASSRTSARDLMAPRSARRDSE